VGYLSKENPLYAAFCPSRVKKPGKGKKENTVSVFAERRCIAAFPLVV
jgi:hypothetical protein